MPRSRRSPLWTSDMEPRWDRRFGDAFAFVGGTNKADIYVSEVNKEIRLVWDADSLGSWHWIEYDKDKERMSFDAALLVDPLNEEELKEAHNYLRLFAPWVLESL